MKLTKQKSFIFFIFFIFLIPIIISEEAKIKIEHTGYGQTSQAAQFSIYNIGEIQLTNINITVDGKLYETIEGSIGPKIGLKTTVYLSPGTHMIEVKTPEHAYDSINITISSAKEKTVTTVGDETTEKSQEIKISVVVFLLIIIFVVVAWILLRKPKLEM